MRTLIVRRTGGLGDALMTLPAIRSYVEENGGELDYAVHESLLGFVERPYIDHVLDARFAVLKGYDRVYDLTPVAVSYELPGTISLNRIDIYAKALGVQPTDWIPDYQVDEVSRRWAQKYITNVPLVVIAPEADDRFRMLPDSTLERLLLWLNEIPVRIVVGRKEDMSLERLAALIEIADVFVGPDSGPQHIAAALNVPSVVWMGAIPVEARLSRYPTHIGVAPPKPCLGWHKTQCRTRCCMEEIGIEQLILAISQQLNLHYSESGAERCLKRRTTSTY